MRACSPFLALSPELCYLGNTRDDERAPLGGCLLGCPPTGLSQLANCCLCYRIQAIGKVALPCWGIQKIRGFTFHLAPSWVRTPLAPPRVVLDYRDLTAPEARSFPFPTHGCCCGRHCWGHCSHSARLSSSQSPPPWMGSGRGSLRGGGGSVSWEAPPLLSLSRCSLWLTQRAKMIKGD